MIWAGGSRMACYTIDLVNIFSEPRYFACLVFLHLEVRFPNDVMLYSSFDSHSFVFFGFRSTDFCCSLSMKNLENK